MKKTVCTLSLALTLGACASSPETAAPAQSTSPAAAAPTENLPPSDEHTSGTAPVRQTGGSSASGATAGWRVVERDGEKYYCSTRPQLGTRVQSKGQCLTAAEYEARRDGARDTMRQKQGQRVISDY